MLTVVQRSDIRYVARETVSGTTPAQRRQLAELAVALNTTKEITCSAAHWTTIRQALGAMAPSLAMALDALLAAARSTDRPLSWSASPSPPS